MEINLISQRIGVFYKNKEIAENFLKELLEPIPKDAIKYIHKDRDVLGVELIEGTVIECRNINNSMRGHRYNKIFVEKDISKELFENRCLPYYHPEWGAKPQVFNVNNNISKTDHAGCYYHTIC